MSYKAIDVKLAGKLVHHCHFNQAEIEMLIGHFRKVCKENTMEKSVFFDVLQTTFEMTESLLMERIFRVFDKDNSGKLSIEEWVQGMSIFLCGTMEEKMMFCFRIYDISSEGSISREVIYTLLKNRTYRTADEEPDQDKEFVDMIMNMMECGQEEYLSFGNYKKAVEKEPLLMQAFAPCLPDDKTRSSFLATFKKNLPKWR